MNTGIYVRVSTEEQAQEGYSIRAQEQKLRDFARIKEWTIFNVYIDDGISGKNIKDRPAVNNLISDIEKGKVKNVLVYKIDRLTRSTIDLINFVNMFNTYDCAFNSLMESIDTQTASGRMFLKIIGIFAEFERENIIERSRLGFERKAREGYSLCTRTASYGYDKKPKEIQTVNVIEAEIVKEIFDMFINGNLSCFEIAKSLNHRNIATKENSTWHARTVKNVLTNCNYIGNVRYATKDDKRHFEVKGLHEPILSQELYYEAQDLMSKMSKKNYTKRPKEEHYFLGILVCAKCGSKFVTHGSYNTGKDGTIKVLGSYRCSNRIKKTCDCANISHLKVAAAFENYIDNINDFDEKVEVTNQEQKTKEDLITAYQNKLEILEKKEQEILALYISDNLNYDNYIKIKKTIEADRNQIIKKLDELSSYEAEKQIMILQEDIISNLKENWRLLTDTEKRQFLVRFIKEIEITVENRTPIIKLVKFHEE